MTQKKDSISDETLTPQLEANPPQGTLTHLDKDGAARMVDIGHKVITKRHAIASALVLMRPDTRTLLMEQKLPKGDALQVARIAGIMGAKKTADLIPLCHPLALTKIEVDFIPVGDNAIRVSAEVHTQGKTGVEMEALTAASIASLTLYDMAKAVDPSMVIDGLHLQEKTGGKRGHWTHPTTQSS